jgi:hypothetical protein
MGSVVDKMTRLAMQHQRSQYNKDMQVYQAALEVWVFYRRAHVEWRRRRGGEV